MFVADHVRGLKIEIEFAGSCGDHAGVGFAPIVFLIEWRVGACGMKRASVPGVDELVAEKWVWGVWFGGWVEECAELIIDAIDIAQCSSASGDAALVGDDDEAIACVFECDERFA